MSPDLTVTSSNWPRLRYFLREASMVAASAGVGGGAYFMFHTMIIRQMDPFLRPLPVGQVLDLLDTPSSLAGIVSCCMAIKAAKSIRSAFPMPGDAYGYDVYAAISTLCGFFILGDVLDLPWSMLWK